MQRTIGPPTDQRFIHASTVCNGSDPTNLKFGTCSILIYCIYANIDQAFQASLSSGTNIASLLPTILVLISVFSIPWLDKPSELFMTRISCLAKFAAFVMQSIDFYSDKIHHHSNLFNLLCYLPTGLLQHAVLVLVFLLAFLGS